MIEFSLKAGETKVQVPNENFAEMLIRVGGDLIVNNFTLFFLLIVIIIYRKHFGKILEIFTRKIASAVEIEIRGIKIKGPLITNAGNLIKGTEEAVKVSEATSSDFKKLREYKLQKRNIGLTHTIRPTPKEEYIKDLRVF